MKQNRVPNIGGVATGAKIVCFCKVSQRGYEAQRVLDGEALVSGLIQMKVKIPSVERA